VLSILQDIFSSRIHSLVQHYNERSYEVVVHNIQTTLEVHLKRVVLQVDIANFNIVFHQVVF
jgi:hypothetical protein